MPDPASDLQSKICRAIKALLIAEGAGSEEDTIAAPSQAARPIPNTTILAGDGTPFSGPGNWQHPVTIDLRDTALTQPEETNPNRTRIDANNRCTRIVNALTRSDDTHTLYYTAQQLTAAGRAMATAVNSSAEAIQFAEDNADMAEFTVLWWEAVGSGTAQTMNGGEAGMFFQRDIQFNCVACNAVL